MKKMKKVKIMRGPSGSGKSSYVKYKLFPNHDTAVVISTDNFFMVEVDRQLPFGDVAHTSADLVTTEYKFEVAKLSEFHATSVRDFTNALKEGKELVIVDNTNIKLWQFAHYISIAELAGYEVEVISFMGLTIEDIKICAERNAHKVPIDIIARMFYEFEPYDGEELMGIKSS